MRLAQQFIGLAGRPAAAASPQLESALQAALESARATWPTVELPTDVFLKFLAERVGPEESDLLACLNQLRTAELYLACGCVLGDPRAVAAFERAFIPSVDSYLAGTGMSDVSRDELRQSLRERVLVAREDQPPKIALYSGRGPLGAWLRMVTVRLATDLLRQRTGERRDPDVTVPIEAADPELRYLKERYRPEFEAALEEACRRLSPHDGTVMRLHFVDGTPLSAIARMYNVSARTVQRWVAAAQTQIVNDVRGRLTKKLALTSSELDGLLALVASRLNISLHRLFADPSPP